MLRNLAVALSVTTDSLIFGNDERGPNDTLALVFEAASQLDPDGQALVKAVIEGIILRQHSRRFADAS